MIEDPAFSKVREFVLLFDGIRDLQFGAVPYPLDRHQGIAYLLLVASVNQSTAAEHVRDLMTALYHELGEDLLRIHSVPRLRYESVWHEHGVGGWYIWDRIPSILSSASQFIEGTEKQGGLVSWGRKQLDTVTAADMIATNVYYMGRDPQGARKKTWMFMRWMVRATPDIGVWSPALSPADLRVPLDRNTGTAFSDLADLPPFKDRMDEKGMGFELESGRKLKSTALNVEMVTEVARWLFPDDPARVDYPFFCYGRRFRRGEDQHRCWSVVRCDQCPMRDRVACSGNGR
jgi:hypothetical protein